MLQNCGYSTNTVYCHLKTCLGPTFRSDYIAYHANIDLSRLGPRPNRVPDRIEFLLIGEFLRSRDAILMITGNKELLEGTPWLKESIRMRNRYIDPLNLIQVELLRRSRNCPDASEEQIEELRHLTRLTIKGLAAGMRTSG